MSQDSGNESKLESELEQYQENGKTTSEEEGSPKTIQEKAKGFISDFQSNIRKPKNTIIAISAIGFGVLVISKLLFASPSNQSNRFESRVDVDSEGIEEIEEVEEAVEPEGMELMGGMDLEDIDSRSAIPIEPPSIPELPELKFDIPKPTVQEPEGETGKDNIIDIGQIDLSVFKKPEEESVEEKKEPEKASEATPEEVETQLRELEEKPEEIVIKKVRKRNPDEKLPPLFDLSGGGPEALARQAAEELKRKQKESAVSDFIFIDSYLNVEPEEDPIETKRIKDLSNTIAQGRIIRGILETAINSEIPGVVRAMVSRDIRGEIARNILVPKGTRIYGSYSNVGAAAGQPISKSRIIITWHRMIRPDGISVNINSTAVDQFGRTGIMGRVDNKVVETVSASVLLSIIPLATAVAVSSLAGTNGNNSPTTTINSMTGTQTVTNDPVNIAIESFTRQVSQTTQDVIKNLINTTPTITLNQGTRVDLIVNKDMKLPTYKPVTKSYTNIR